MSGFKRVWVYDRSVDLAIQQQEFKASFATAVASTMASGSRQPTAIEFKRIIADIISSKKADAVLIIDLRDEFHFFCEQGPIGLENIDAETKIVAAEYTKDCELELAKRLALNTELEIYTKHKDSKIPHKFSSELINPGAIKTEEEIVIGLGAMYERFPVTDHGVPNPELIDRFVKFTHNLPVNTWVHFHCHGGKGRTSTFMAMYNLLYFARNPSAMPTEYDALNHPKLKTKDDRRTSIEQLNRIAFMQEFKLYVNAYGAAIKESTEPLLWSKWREQQSAQQLLPLYHYHPAETEQVQASIHQTII